MLSPVHLSNKQLIKRLAAAQYDYDPQSVQAVLQAVFHPTANIQLAYPFEQMQGPEALYRLVYQPLATAIVDLERRDTIVLSGASSAGDWVGCCGYYTGLFAHPWLDILPTGHHMAMRFHEFYRIEDGKIVEMQALWDLPELMLQAGVWPMAPSLGHEWQVPGPATQDGLQQQLGDAQQSAASLRLVAQMCEALGRYADAGVDGMQLSRYWHPKCSWYGPSAIGTCRGIQGFRQWHQKPFLQALPDRRNLMAQGHLFSEGAYVGFTAWPGMAATVSADGWMGIAPAQQAITLRSLDFWRCEHGVIRENWVLVDILSVYAQLGVDVLARMREFSRARMPPPWRG